MNTKKSFLLLLLIVLSDQLTKYLARLFSWPIYYNFGISFGLLQSQNLGVLIYGLVYLILLGLVGYLIFNKSKDQNLLASFILLLAGGVGNSIDRLLNSGGVIDFISIGKLPIFNIADFSISIGAFLFIYYEFKQK